MCEPWISKDERAFVFKGDCREVMKSLPEASVTSIVTDPPYGLSFMGKQWDHGVPGKEFWVDALRVAKPGAMLLAFGGTRTFHRLACAIEDAGWELRDTMMWVYGSGFPKSMDISKALDKSEGADRKCTKEGQVKRDGYGEDWDTGSSSDRPRFDIPVSDAAKLWSGYGTALKPAWEPIIVAMKPCDGTFANNAKVHGVAEINVDGCRVQTDETIRNHARGEESAISKGKYGDSTAQDTHQTAGQSLGRFPANLIHDGSDEVVGLFPNCKSGKPSGNRNVAGFATAKEHGTELTGFGDDGSAARFFYCAKASKSERTHGGKVENNHPTVKPQALMRYLVRLVSPPTGGVLLDPFCGSGSTLVAAMAEGQEAVGIEQDEDSATTTINRIEASEEQK